MELGLYAFNDKTKHIQFLLIEKCQNVRLT